LGGDGFGEGGGTASSCRISARISGEDVLVLDWDGAPIHGKELQRHIRVEVGAFAGIQAAAAIEERRLAKTADTSK